MRGWGSASRVGRLSVDVGGRPFRYRVAGAGSPLILIHGLSGSSRWWARNVDAFARQFRVYLVDLPGFGDNRGRRRFALESAAAELVAWMDAVGIARASIVGHSMGGFVAADLAASFSDRVDRLVLADAAVRPYDRRFLQPVVGGLGTAWRLPLGFLPVLVADAVRAGPRTLRLAMRALLNADLRARLDKIASPTLVIWGERDSLVPIAYGRRLAEALPDAGFAVIGQAGHNSMWDQPDAFNRVALAFLAGSRNDSALCE